MMKTLFDQTSIHSMRLKNRFVRGATWENMADSNGYITARLLSVYEDLAKGNVKTVIARPGAYSVLAVWGF